MPSAHAEGGFSEGPQDPYFPDPHGTPIEAWVVGVGPTPGAYNILRPVHQSRRIAVQMVSLGSGHPIPAAISAHMVH